MATTTTHYGFTKPGTQDRVDITVIDAILDQLDAQLYANSQVIGGVVVRVQYNYTTNAYASSRPPAAGAGMVEFIGPVVPPDIQDGDTWIDNS